MAGIPVSSTLLHIESSKSLNQNNAISFHLSFLILRHKKEVRGGGARVSIVLTFLALLGLKEDALSTYLDFETLEKFPILYILSSFFRCSSFKETVFRIRSGSVSFGPPGCVIFCADPDPSTYKQKIRKTSNSIHTILRLLTTLLSLKTDLPTVSNKPKTLAKFLVPDWGGGGGGKVDFGIGLSYRPTSLNSLAHQYDDPMP